MRIGIIMIGEDQAASAGVRIRYKRLQPHLEAAGHHLELIPIDSFSRGRAFECEAYFFCKCYDVRALVLADLMRRAGRIVGVDLFDDYFSQVANARFVHLRTWFAGIAPNLSCAICSTPRMRAVLAALAAELPVRIVNDPFDRFDADRIAASVSANGDAARRTRRLPIAWFGMGDNPHFPVGLHDLAAFADILGACRRHGFRPELTILTNRRALGVERLEAIARLGIPSRLEEWTEPLEREVVSRSVFCFLPVNLQGFSTVKSLNRAVTALAGGSQVLSAGYPLYAGLHPFVYRDIDALLDDVEAGRPAVNGDTVRALKERLETLADPAAEAAGLVAFLASVEPPLVDPEPVRYAVVHGRKSLGAIHKQVQQLGHLSVASAFATEVLHYDVLPGVDPVTGDPGLLLTDRAVACLREPLRVAVTPHPAVGKVAYHRLPASTISSSLDGFTRPACFQAVELSVYGDRMASVETVLREVLEGHLVVLRSELESPYWMPDANAAQVSTAQEAGQRDAA